MNATGVNTTRVNATCTKVFFDTSVLVAAFVPAHPRHERAFDRFRKALVGECHMLTSAHNIAELYAVLTTLPLSPRIAPSAAARIVRENLERKAEIIPITVNHYFESVQQLGQTGLSGGVIYDAVACRAAVDAGAELILTYNPKDFRRVLTDARVRVEEP